MIINKPIITMELNPDEREILQEANEIWEEIVTKMSELNVESIAEDEVEVINKDEIEVFLDRATALLDTTTRLELI